jgi:hypothetical protein
METYTNPTVLNGTAGNSAPVGGRRRKLQLVTKKQARKMLKKMGKKLRGGGDADPVVVEAPAPAPKMGGKKTKKRSASRRSASRKSIFGL